MIDGLLRAHGLHTGRYTSPHLADGAGADQPGRRTGRARGGSSRSIGRWRRWSRWWTSAAREPLTYFDVTTAMAFAAFADAPVDVAVVEVGLGGADDATNVLQAGVCVITPIGLDHTEWLGDTLERHRLGQGRHHPQGSDVVSAAQDEEACPPILERCAEVGATVAREGSEFGVLRRGGRGGRPDATLQGLGGLYEEVFLPMHGAHQAQNAAVALAAVEAFLGAGTSGPSTPRWCATGSAAVTSPGGWSGCAARRPSCWTPRTTRMAWPPRWPRWRRSSRSPGWSPSSRCSPTRMCGMLELLEPVADALVVTRNSSSRAMPAQRLGGDRRGDLRRRAGTRGGDLPDAIEAAVELAEADLEGELSGVGVLVTGSVFTVADARKLLER